MGKSRHIFFWSILLTFMVSQVNAQLVEFGPIPKIQIKHQSKADLNARLNSQNQLPFWDDFSEGMDTLKWEFSGSTYSSSIGNHAPSFGVIVLDGVDETGSPYSRQIREQGAGDYITSKPIDLSVIPSNQQESTFLSFFWQAGGKAEMPDEGDALTLEFLTADSVWATIWQMNGGPERDRENFTQEIVPISSEYFHSEFRFRFVNQGRLSGPFDTWLLDYVYLNSGRDSEDLFYLDRALTRNSYFFAGDYAAIPLEFYSELSSEEVLPIANEFNNLENRFRSMEYSILLANESGNRTTVNLNTPFNPVPNAQERRVFESNSINNLPEIQQQTDLEVLTYLTTGDNNYFEISQGDTTFFENIDYRINDTVRTFFPVRDYFAYDVGSADYSAGINQRSGMLAVKYEVDQPVFLTGISIDFTNPSQADQPIDILIWNNLEATPLFKKETLIPLKEEGEDLIFFPIDTNIRVQGEFYVGFAQFSNDFLYVGLSKENDQADKIFYNINGAWAQNEEVRGSLIIRPHVSVAPPFEELEIRPENLRYYPNPVESNLHIQGNFQELRIFDSFGREIFPERIKDAQGEIINFIKQIPGIYVINVITPQGPKSIRILVK
ncbi:T9SS type A sorting domain-containing protein [Algoriphagus limi]|uniref:T9SS type A sorting domain-containing protein n=1 Tax=Algoriphagus limi TaxID=2975273 RepID=A0ABT2G554_9BACT|nr:T9SS type A sorting domain-containing protein [Algoriphagus limi]MCS5489082.1 T9SS type A sorting domain-containing protein [Algoriphagus limi]